MRKLLWLTSTLAATAILFIAAGNASARILNVPEDYQTIQAGIDSSQDGDTVLVQPGDYHERIDFTGKNIKLIGTPEVPYRTVIDGDANGCVVTFNQGESSDAVLSGFKIRNGQNQNGGGIAILRSSPTLEHLIVTSNSADRGGGIYSYYSDFSMSDILLRANTSVSWGAGFYSEGGNLIEMSEVFVCGNNSGDGDANGIMFYNVVQSELSGITVADNTGPGSSVLIAASGIAAVTTMRNSIVWGNSGIELQLDPRRGRSNTINVSYSDMGGQIFGGTVNWGAGCIDTDPLYRDRDNGDYSLSADSPCIDTGDPDSPLDPDGTRADMGAFYFHQRDIAVDQDTLYFGPMYSARTDSLPVTILNVGGATLHISSQTITSEAVDEHVAFSFGSGAGAFELPPDSSHHTWIIFYAIWENLWEGTLRIESDDLDHPELNVTLLGDVLTVSDPQLSAFSFQLSPAYPNPFNSTTTIRYSTGSAARPTRLAVYGIDGRLVKELLAGQGASANPLRLTESTSSADRRGSAEDATVVWDAEGLPGGIYLIRLEAGGEVRTMKTVLLK